MEIKLLHPQKASMPIQVTLSGIVIEVKLLQPQKASSPMHVTLFGMIVFLQPTTRVFVFVAIMALQLLRESNFGLPFSTIMEVRPPQSPKAYSPILVTLFPMVTEFSQEP